jgi:hypothetical protein
MAAKHTQGRASGKLHGGSRITLHRRFSSLFCIPLPASHLPRWADNQWNFSAPQQFCCQRTPQLEGKMGRYALLWLLGVPIPILLLIYLFGGLH